MFFVVFGYLYSSELHNFENVSSLSGFDFSVVTDKVNRSLNSIIHVDLMQCF